MNAELTAVVSQDPLLLCTPMPHHDSAVLGARHHIAVLTDVTFWPSNTCHNIIMSEYRLYNRTWTQHYMACHINLIMYVTEYEWLAVTLLQLSYRILAYKALHLIYPNCYNIMNPHRLCDLPLLFNSLFHDTTLNLARVHFESQHQKSGTYCLLVSIILHQSLHFVGI